jgi:hypothetical protein
MISSSELEELLSSPLPLQRIESTPKENAGLRMNLMSLNGPQQDRRCLRPAEVCALRQPKKTSLVRVAKTRPFHDRQADLYHTANKQDM